MDWIESLLPFLIFLFYLWSQVRKARRKAQPAPTASVERAEAPPPPRAPPRRTPFELLIEQIQAAAEAEREADAPTFPSPRPQPAPTASPLPGAASEFELTGAFEHDRHGFGPENPFSEEAFERLPLGLDITEHPAGHLDAGPHVLRSDQASTGPHPLVTMLRNPGAARRAVALKEILDGPRSKRPYRRP